MFIWNGKNRPLPCGWPGWPQDHPGRADGLTVETIWRAYEIRWPIEPGLHFRKATLGWTMPRFQTKEAGDRWTWLTALAAWMIFLARAIVADPHCPGRNPSST